jgi:hypothetical protein
MEQHLVLVDAYVKLDELVLADATASVAISMSAEPSAEFGTMGDRNVKRFDGGPIDWAAEIELVLNEQTHGQYLFGAVGSAVEIEVRKMSDPVSAENPTYKGMAILTAYNPTGSGEWGDVVTASLSFVAAGPLTRETVAA